jgi:hypothetical protein
VSDFGNELEKKNWFMKRNVFEKNGLWVKTAAATSTALERVSV